MPIPLDGFAAGRNPAIQILSGRSRLELARFCRNKGDQKCRNFLEARCTCTDFVTGHRFMATLGHKKLTVVAFTLSTPAEIDFHVTRGYFVRKIVDVVFTNRALSPLIGSLSWRWYEARGSAGHLTTLQAIIVDFKAGISLKKSPKLSALRKAVLRMLHHATFQARTFNCAYRWCSQAHQPDCHSQDSPP